MTGQISDAIEAYLEEFEEQTGIQVNLELYGEAQLRKMYNGIPGRIIHH